MTPPPLDFDIDKHLNRFIPASRLHLLPKSLSWFLGYRTQPRKPVGSVVVWWWAFIGAFAGLLVVEAVYMIPGLKREGAPIIIASLGAAAILEYHTVDSPLAQPRAAILGQLISAIVGISITKLFLFSPHFNSLRFLAGALSVGISSALMGLTKTVHPPAGATALLCSTTPAIEELGWFLIPLILIGSILLVAVGCVLNNVQRTFPVFWWTPVDLSRDARKGDIERAEDVKGKDGGAEEGVEGNAESGGYGDASGRIEINGEGIVVPAWLDLGYEETAMLEILRHRLGERRRRESGGVLQGVRSWDSVRTVDTQATRVPIPSTEITG